MGRLALLIIGLGAELEDLGGWIVGIGERLLPDKPDQPDPLYHSNGQLDEHPTFKVHLD